MRTIIAFAIVLLGLPALPRDWPRSIHGELIESLKRRGAEVIVFDIHFGREKDPGADQALVEAVARAGYGRLVAILAGEENIREIIAYPKTQSGSDPMTNSPIPGDPQTLGELGLKILPPTS